MYSFNPIWDPQALNYFTKRKNLNHILPLHFDFMSRSNQAFPIHRDTKYISAVYLLNGILKTSQTIQTCPRFCFSNTNCKICERAHNYEQIPLILKVLKIWHTVTSCESLGVLAPRLPLSSIDCSTWYKQVQQWFRCQKCPSKKKT